MLFLRIVCPSSKIVSVSGVDDEAGLFSRIRNLKVEPIEPNLVGGNVSVFVFAGE